MLIQTLNSNSKLELKQTQLAFVQSLYIIIDLSTRRWRSSLTRFTILLDKRFVHVSVCEHVVKILLRAIAKRNSAMSFWASYWCM